MSRRVCVSTTESECHGLVEAWREATWQRLFLDELSIVPNDGPVRVREDNSGAITLGGAGSYHKRAKHYIIEWYAVKEAIEANEITLEKVGTDDQEADFLTKALVRKAFYKHRAAVMGSEALQQHFAQNV